MKKLLLISIICSLALYSLAGCSNNDSAASLTSEGQSYSSDSGSGGSDGEYSSSADSSGNSESGQNSAESADGESDKGSESGDDGGDSGDLGGEGSSSSDGGGSESQMSGDGGESDEIASAVVGSWAPYAAHKTDNPDEKISMQSIFGENFRFGGTLTLNSDFSFSDNVCGAATGTYSVSGRSITLSYDGGEPVTLLLTGYPNNSSLEREVKINGESCTIYYTM